MNLQSPIAPTVVKQSTPLNNSWFSPVNDFLSQGLQLYSQYDQIERAKDAGGNAQKELTQTVQTPSPAAGTTTPAQDLKAKMAQGLQIGTGTMIAAIGGVAVLFWLTRK